jgi:Zn-dependent peptidase ImmA (M78 family)
LAKKYRAFGEIEEVARRLRIKLNVDRLERPALINIFEKGLNDLYPDLRLIRVLDEQLPESEARTDCYEQTITVRESVYQACLRGEARARMTLAHELGHIALGHSGTRHRQNIGLGTRNEQREEAEAWHFARVFLAPTFMAVTCKTADEIRMRFGLSGDAADIRFGQLAELAKQGTPPSERWKSTPTRKKEDPRDSQGRRILPESVVVRLTEARRQGHRVTSLDSVDDDDDDDDDDEK